jgi:hypothetical protein
VRPGQRLRRVDADEQRAGEARSGGHGDAAKFAPTARRFRQRRIRLG